MEEFRTKEVLARLIVSLLGAPRVEVDGRAVEVDTRKAIALLAYLALTHEGHRRDALATLLWPDYDQERARAALRRTLSALKAGLGEGWLEVSRESIGLGRSADLWLDVEEFNRLIAENHPEHLEEAAALYRGDFLEGFTLRDSPNFDDWQFFEAEQLRHRLAGGLERLVQALAEQGRLEEAAEHARRWVALDPLHEPAHRWLMTVHAWAGDRGAALRQYRECVRILDAELGVPPLDETTQLSEAILENRVEPRLRIEPHPAPASPARRAAYPLVGRSAAWSALSKAHAAGSGHLAVIEGEAGIGKTRLAEEFLTQTRAGGAVVMGSRCYQGEQGLAFGPIADLVRSVLAESAASLGDLPDHWLGEAARLVPELRELRPGLPELPPSEAAQARFFEALRQVLLAPVIADTASVLFLDDLHWADQSSLDFLRYMVRRPEKGSLGVLVTWRTEEVPPGHTLRGWLDELRRAGRATLVSLPRLAKEDVAVLARGAGLSEELTDGLYEETEGLPFFVVEWLEAIGHGADPERGFVGGRLLRSRLETVGELARQVLTAAAVVGRSFDFETISSAGGRTEEETVDALEELTLRGLIRELPMKGALPSYDFSHDRLRRLVYEDASLARRRLLHRRVADALATRATRDGRLPSSLVAFHYQSAGEDERAAQWHHRAGEQARAVYANREAIEHFQAALALGHEDRAPLHEAVADLLTLVGEYGEAQANYEMAAALVSPHDLATVEHKLGNLYGRRGVWELAEGHFEVAFEALGEVGVPGRRARLLADWSLAVHRLGRTDEAIRLAEEALRLAEGADDLQALAQTHNILGVLAKGGGELETARRHLERSMGLAELLGDIPAQVAALNNLSLVLGAAGASEEGVELLQRALAVGKSQEDRHREAALHNNLADLLRAAGRHEEAMSHLKEAVGLFAEIGADEESPMQPEIWKLVEW
jgi:DNA-binding SARP family transcriptional activator